MWKELQQFLANTGSNLVAWIKMKQITTRAFGCFTSVVTSEKLLLATLAGPAILPSLERAAVLKLFGLDQESKCIKIHQSKSNQTIHQHTRTAKRPKRGRHLAGSLFTQVLSLRTKLAELKTGRVFDCFCGHCFPQLTWLKKLSQHPAIFRPRPQRFSNVRGHGGPMPSSAVARQLSWAVFVCRSSKGNQWEYHDNPTLVKMGIIWYNYILFTYQRYNGNIYIYIL